MKNNLTQNILKIFVILAVISYILYYPVIINAVSVGPNSPGTTADDATVGSVTWSNPNNSQASDDVYATMSIGFNGRGHYLKATNFGFSLSSSASINGIVVQIEKKQTNSNGGDAVDNSIKIVKSDGTIGTTEKADTTTSYPTSDTVITYGSSSDLWGETWTYSDINNANFGVVFSAAEPWMDVRNTPPQSTTVYIDHAKITVYYTLNLPVITTPTQTSITANGATLGGNVTGDGGSAITGRGVCVGTSANPAVGGNCFSTSGTTGVFTVNATGLSGNTLYHYRAYATNANGTSYTTDDTFTTLVAECASSSTGDRFTLNESCSFPGLLLDGIDKNGANSTNSAILTVVTGVTLTVPAQQTLATGTIDLKGGGSIVIIKPGKIKLKTLIYMTDSDSDGYPASTSATLIPNVGTGDKRKYTITSLTSTDCKDSGTNANLVYVSKTCYLDNDGDTYSSSTTKTCTNNSTCSSATYASTGSNNDVVQYGAGVTPKLEAANDSDCNDSLTNNQNTLSSTFNADNDLDGWTGAQVGGASDICSTASTWDTATQSSIPGGTSNFATFSAGARKAAASSPSDVNDNQKCAVADTPSTSGSALYNTTCRKCTTGALANQANTEDLYNQCTATGTVVRLNSIPDTTSCTSLCASYTHTEALCSGTGASCATHSGACADAGYDANATNNLGIVFFGGACHTGAANCGTTTIYTAAQSCLGNTTPWINCKCQ
ncbi:MAG: hypothetical protein WCT22_00430 [Patescibacteria group bacterium]